MIDLHCHILPDLDDGPETLAESLDMAQAAVAAGATTIVATPHVSWEWPEVTAAVIAAKVAELNAALLDHDIDLEVRPGAEIALTRAADLPDAELRALRLGGGAWLLAECPLSPSVVGVERALASLVTAGHRVVLAHPERSPGLQRDTALLARLVDQGMLVSITAGSLVGRFGKTVQSAAEEMLARRLVHNVASDAHSVVRRPPSIRTELAQAGLSSQSDWLARQVPLAVISGATPPPMPVMPPLRRPSPLARLLRRS